MSELSIEEYLNELFEGESGEDVEAARKAILGREKVSKKLKESQLRQSDYSRQMDLLKKEKSDIEKALTWVKEQQGINHNNKVYVEELAAEKARLEDELKGVKTQMTQVPNDLETKLSEMKSQWDKEKSDIQLNGIQLFATAIDLTNDFNEKYGKRLKAQELFKKAMDEGRTVQDVYGELAAPLEAEKHEKEIQEKIEKARKEERELVLSKVQHPEMITRNTTPVMSILSKKPAEAPTESSSRVANAVAAWNKATMGK